MRQRTYRPKDGSVLCRNRRCVRPSHLEPVTASENVKRSIAARQEVAA